MVVLDKSKLGKVYKEIAGESKSIGRNKEITTSNKKPLESKGSG